MRSRRFLVPVGVVGLIALGTAVPHFSSASAATPDLPSITPAQLLAKVEQAKVAGYSGTVKWSPDLGLPDVSALTGGDGQSISSGSFDPSSLLTSGASFKVWDAGTTEQRLALAPSSLTEVDVVRNGDQVWTSDSSTQRVTHYVFTPGAGKPADPAGTPPTPAQAASELLSSITPTTAVSVVTPVYVAGRPTYELRLAPRTADSTIQFVTIAVDAATGLPMRVQVTPKGSAVPALSLGYTSISFAVPAASTFAPLVGASTVTHTIGGRHKGGHGVPRPAGAAPAAFDPASGQSRSGQPQSGQPQFGHAPFGHRHGHWTSGRPAGFNPADFHGSPGHGSPGEGALGRGDRVTTTGSGWQTVAVFSGAAGELGSTKELDDVSKAVTLADGTTARLVTSRLVDALVLPDGRVYAGFVTPAALEAAAGAAGSAAS